jgi:hypothetical protein
LIRSDREVAATVDRWTAWPVYWGPVILGAMAAVVATVLLGLIGTAIGAHKAGTEGRITTWSGVGFAGLAFAVISSFFAFVIGGWVAVRVAGIRRSEPAVLHGAISWVVAVFVMVLIAGLSGAIFNGWYTSLAPTPAVPAVPGSPVDPSVAIAARNGALAAAAALLMGLMGSVIGAWVASGEPMTVGSYRVRVEPLAPTRGDRTTRI